MPSTTTDFWQRLREIDMFFDGTSAVHQTMHRLTKRLSAAGIAYAVMGGMAVNAHGAARTTADLDVLLTREGLAWFRRELAGTEYDPVQGRSRSFTDRENEVKVDLLVAGHLPGMGGPAPFPFPDPTAASEEINGIRVVTLPQLIQLKLAAGRHYDFGDVVFLIRTLHLDESFTNCLHPAVHGDFIECLEEQRREDEYAARDQAD